MTRRIFGVAAVVAILAGLSGVSAQADTIRVQSTTDTVDEGLKDGLIVPGYAAAQPGDTLQYTSVGTGKALDNARARLADVVITHAPSGCVRNAVWNPDQCRGFALRSCDDARPWASTV